MWQEVLLKLHDFWCLEIFKLKSNEKNTILVLDGTVGFQHLFFRFRKLIFTFINTVLYILNNMWNKITFFTVHHLALYLCLHECLYEIFEFWFRVTAVTSNLIRYQSGLIMFCFFSLHAFIVDSSSNLFSMLYPVFVLVFCFLE